MNGNQNQYNPTQMFQEWIQKSGKAQAEFMKNFSSIMNDDSSRSFDPLETLKEITSKTTEVQNNFMQNLGNMQSKGMDKLFNLGQVMPNFMSWGAYKTTIGSNGRISIPEAERDALGLKEGDLIQVVILPIEKRSKKKEVKK